MDTQQNIFYQSDFGCTQCWTPNYIIIRLDFLAAPLFGHMDKHLKLWYIFLRKGITVMAKQFTKVEQEILRANPFTLDVNERYIKFTVDFKRFLLNEISKPGVTHKQAFRNAGYDPDILGQNRVVNTVKAIRREAASPKGIHDTGPSRDRLARQDLSKKRYETAIKELQQELVKTQQELEFIKKILQLPSKDAGTP